MQTLPFSLPNYPYSLEEIQKRINQIINQELPFSNEEAYQTALHCIDLTTLEGSDTEQKVRELCQKAIKYNCAAVCVYPPFVALAKECLKNSKIRVASVAGAFPAGQSPIEIKVADVAITRQHHLIDTMLDARVGDEIVFTVLRNNEEITISITVNENCLTKY